MENSKKPIELILENAQVGDKVLYNKQRGYIIGQSSEGDLIVQIQGSTEWAKPKDVQVLRGQANPTEKFKQFKFDEKTQKLLFEQYIKCGIYMKNIPIKLNDCYVKYSDFKIAKMNEELNVFSGGEITPMDRENVKILEDPNDFANPEDYIQGVITGEIEGQAIQSVLINVMDYTGAIGDADQVRIILLDENGDPGSLENYPKGALKTLSI